MVHASDEKCLIISSILNVSNNLVPAKKIRVLMIIVGAKTPNLLLLLYAIILCSLSPRFCRAQGNNNTSSSSNPCETSGTCGPFGICDSQGSPTCTCLQGFYPRHSGNWSSGCVRRVPLNCEAGNNGTINGGKQDGFLKYQMMLISDYSERWFGPISECEGLCLRNCSCFAYMHGSTVGCMFWNRNLTDIQYHSSESDSDLYIRVSASELDKKKDPKKIIIIVVVVGFVTISISACFSWKWIAKRRRGKKRTIELGKAGPFGTVGTSLEYEYASSQVNLEELPLFAFEILSNATNNFADAKKLGRGGFGTVYKGELADGREIAVKRLSQTSTQGMQEFLNEMALITKLQHRNLVRLLGCCVENKETMLIYEYMPNKSLDFFLFDPSQDVLDWRKRFNIIEGICRGLLYLHRDSRLKIIHRDLKPSNVLLDNDWDPKISDFGMARIFGTQQDHVSTIRVVGTYGYMAPEYALKGRFSEKSDVFSFGVLVLEIATGRRNRSFHHQDGSLNLLGHIWKKWNEGNVASTIDPRISGLSYRAEVVRCINIALLCVQQLSMDRPSVSTVLSMLSSEIVELPEPKQSAFIVDLSDSDAGTSWSQQADISLSMFNGR